MLGELVTILTKLPNDLYAMFPLPRLLPLAFNRLMVALLMLGFVAPAAFGAPKQVQSQSAENREFRLFVGIDVKIADGKDFRSVKSYNNGFTTLDDPAAQRIYKDHIQGVDYEHLTRLARHPVVFADLKTAQDRGLDHEALKWMNRQNQMQMLNSVQMDGLQAQVNAAHKAPSAQADTLSPGQIKPEVQQAQQNMSDFSLSQGQIVDGTFYADRISGGAVENPNAVRINMVVSSPVAVTGTYLVCITRISTEEEGYSDRLFFSDLGDIGPEPRPVQILEDGFPEGYHLKSVELHLFKNGRELVTSESDKQFALTRDELHEYVTLERVSLNRGNTLPAEPIWSLAPADLMGAENPQDYDFPVKVKVDPKGRVTALDERLVLPPHIVAGLNEMIFKPALLDGTPVEGAATVNLRDFFR